MIMTATRILNSVVSLPLSSHNIFSPSSRILTVHTALGLPGSSETAISDTCNEESTASKNFSKSIPQDGTFSVITSTEEVLSALKNENFSS